MTASATRSLAGTCCIVPAALLLVARLATAQALAPTAFAPDVPAPSDGGPRVLRVDLETSVQVMPVAPGATYEFWTFNGHVPGPMIRARVGDTLEVHLRNLAPLPHNVDFHAVTGPGGGAAVTTADTGEEKVATFRLMHPGLFVYHCAVTPVPMHLANGMYGLILVEPQRRLPRVDREFYVMQSEIYAGDAPAGGGPVPFSYADGLAERPRWMVFNGRVGALSGAGALHAHAGERIRIYFGNGGPNRTAAFHLIGEIFDRVYREGDLVSRPARSIQTTLVPPGGATVVEVQLDVPGTFVLVDHAIFRTDAGAVGSLVVDGMPRPDIYDPPGTTGGGHGH